MTTLPGQGPGHENIAVLVLGVDENGLGPVLGPLIITGVLVEVKDREELLIRGSGPVRDSKKVFRRSLASYAQAERLALGLLEAAGVPVENSREMAEAVLLESVDIDWCFGKVNLPVWADGGKAHKPWQGPVIKKVLSLVVPVEKLNREANRLMVDLRGFIRIAQAMGDFDLGLFGKIGSKKSYCHDLAKLTREEPVVITEKSGESAYRLGDRVWSFVQDADNIYWPVAAASIVGKFLRELSMLHLNKMAGVPGQIPWCSGYGSKNKGKVKVLVEKLSSRGVDPDRFLRR